MSLPLERLEAVASELFGKDRSRLVHRLLEIWNAESEEDLDEVDQA